MPIDLHIPRRFDPAYSWLGRRLVRRIGDERRAEAFFILWVAAVALALIAVSYAVWMVLPQVAWSESPVRLYAFIGQAALWLVALGSCIWGFRPAINVMLLEDGLCIEQGARTVFLSFNQIREATTITPLLFYRHYCRYAATQAFINSTGTTVLLLETQAGHVGVGLSIEACDLVLQHLSRRSVGYAATLAHAQ